jgi:putative hemolysin
VVPAFTLGANSMLFQFAGMLHPKLRTALLPHEYLNKKERPVEIRIGGVIPAARVADASSDEALMRYLRWRTYLLAYKPRLRRTRRPAAAAGARPNISGEVEALGPDRCLAKAGDLEVYCAQAREIPRLLDEIGDLREITFRAVGEGTGRSRDLDEFDSFYLHLFSWDTKRKEVAGAYRLGLTDEILRARGIRGLYTSTQFRYGQDFVREIQPAIELGRSFIRQEYQRSFSSLLLLWKGIGRFIVDQPRYRFLFGPVSISNDYSQLSRKLLTEYLERNLLDERLSRMVKPRKPFRKFLVPKEAAWSADLEEFSEIIADLEPDGKGVPVLLRQYLKLGGKILGFNVDPKFSQTLDGLIVVDLCLTDRTMLNRYMGSDGASRFLHHHKRLVA